MSIRKFSAATGPGNTIKIFEAATGALYRIITVGRPLASQPICTPTECSVEVFTESRQRETVRYSLPTCNLI